MKRVLYGPIDGFQRFLVAVNESFGVINSLEKSVAFGIVMGLY